MTTINCCAWQPDYRCGLFEVLIHELRVTKYSAHLEQGKIFMLYRRYNTRFYCNLKLFMIRAKVIFSKSLGCMDRITR